jgi:hypothetical protein
MCYVSDKRPIFLLSVDKIVCLFWFEHDKQQILSEPIQQRDCIIKPFTLVISSISNIVVYTQREQTCTARAFDMDLASAEVQKLECFE